MSTWFEHHTFGACTPDPTALVAAKAGRRISVVLPARNEAATVGTIVSTVRAGLVEQHGLVDEVIVVDSRSDDATARTAEEAGARVVSTVDVHPGLDGGKGAALRTGLEAMSGDIGVFLDAELADVGVEFVVGLLAPLLTDPSLVL
ncbi:MAG: glycosyltransferase, partial [Actinomycetales bacterium]